MTYTLSKRITLAAVTALLAVWSLPANAGDSTTKPTGKCMMWTAKSKTATVYMVGSLHKGRPEMYPLPAEMEDAFAKAKLLVEEIKPDEAVDPEDPGDELWRRMHYTDGETLPSHLTADQWADVKSACELVEMPGAGSDLETMKPESLCLCLECLVGKKERQAGKAAAVNPPGIDNYFADAAKKRNLPIEAFETLTFQMDLLLGTSNKIGLRNLLSKVAQIRGAPVKTNDSVAVWSSGDVDSLSKEAADLAKEYPGWSRHALFDRNSRMADKIEQYLQGDKTVFVVVGCLHYAGDRGIVQLLRDDDVDVQQSTATKQEAAVRR